MAFTPLTTKAWTATKSLSSRLDIQRGETVPAAKFTKLQEWLGVSIFSMLFFSWGLAYGLLDIMNYHIKVAIGVNRSMAALLAFSYYAAYIPGSLLIGGPIVKHGGYRMAAVVGLLLLGVGDMAMSQGAQKLNFGMMCGSHLVVGLGVSTLERAANAYAINCGVRARAALRILIAQSAAALGTVIAPLLANGVIFNPITSGVAPLPDPAKPGRCLMPPPPAKDEAGDLTTVVKFYKALGASILVFAAALAVLLFRTRWVIEPEVATSPKLEHSRWKFWKHPLLSMKYSRLWYGVMANFINLGCQVTVAQFFMEHMRINACAGEKASANFMMYAQLLFLFGRLVAAGLVEIGVLQFVKKRPALRTMFKSRWILAGFVLGAVAFTGGGIAARGRLAVGLAGMIMFAEAPSFPMIFESATAGLGPWTSTAESITIVSICGGGVLPVFMGMLVDKVGIAPSWGLVTGCFAFVSSYTLMCNISPGFRMAIDGAHGEKAEADTNDMELHDRDEGQLAQK